MRFVRIEVRVREREAHGRIVGRFAFIELGIGHFSKEIDVNHDGLLCHAPGARPRCAQDAVRKGTTAARKACGFSTCGEWPQFSMTTSREPGMACWYSSPKLSGTRAS